MSDKQNNWLRMFRKVIGVFIANDWIPGRYPSIGTSADKFKEFVEQILKIDEASSSGSGSYEDKIEKKDAMAHEVAELAAAASAYAVDQKDTELLAALKVPYSDVRYADDQRAHSLAMAIYKQLLELGAKLNSYMVTSTDLTGLKGYIDAFRANLESTESNDSVARTRQLDRLFKQANDHLKDHLDQLVIRIKRKEPVFYETYMNARVIHDLGGGRKTEKPGDELL